MNEIDSTLQHDAAQRPRRKGLYVLPNAISLAALFAAFYAIVMAMNGQPSRARMGWG